MKALFTQILLASAMLACHLAPAQDFSEEAYYGSVKLAVGFDSDPHTVSVIAGGTIDLSESAFLQDCVGFVSTSPDYEIEYLEGDGEFSLGFYAEGDVDTVLLINDPNGNWHCNDDYGEGYGLMAGLRFDPPLFGVYDIWVGVYDEEDLYSEVELYITELNELLDSLVEDPELFSNEGQEETGAIRSSGTGFVVSETGHILTNYHVVEDCANLSFQILGRPEVSAAVVSVNEQYDLALLVSELTGSVARFNDQENLRLGDEIIVYGYPLFGDLSSQGNITTGVVSALTGLNDNLANFQISAQIQPGNSGGPVLDRRGSVVGVVVSMANEQYFSQQSGAIPQNVNFAINGGIVRSFLNANNISYTGHESLETLTTADIAELAQSYTGVLSCLN